MRTSLGATVGLLVAALAVTFAGPVRSGAFFLLLPTLRTHASPALPEYHKPRHKGSIDLATGLYVRENEDLVVPGAPALVLRRTYLSRDRVSRVFGVGAMHNGEEYLIGDGERFQWVVLILATGTRINFTRQSTGTSLSNAVFVHEESASEWQGAEIGWTGINWALRKRDGSVAIFRSCGHGSGTACSIAESRDPAGRTIFYRRDRAGRLLKMESGTSRWIAFEYDDRSRITRAHDSTGREVQYQYDGPGRLTRAATNDGIVHRYTYTDLDELATIEEPGTSIENWYENGRCVRQVNRYPDREPYTFDFTYHLENGTVAGTDTWRSDGTWTRHTWTDRRQTATETRGYKDIELSVLRYHFDQGTGAVTAVSVTCPDRQGRPLTHSRLVKGGNRQRVKEDLLRTRCYENRLLAGHSD